MNGFVNFSEEVLADLPLSILREIGRQVGVKAPTASKKEQLITEIMEIQSGKRTPVPHTNKGAPTKIRIPIPESLFKKEVETDKDLEYDKEKVFEKKKDVSVEKENINGYEVPVDNGGGIKFSDVQSEDKIIREGVLEILPEYGFLRVKNCEISDQDIHVSLQNIKRYGLRKGDKIKAVAFRRKATECPSMQDALLINDRDPKQAIGRDNFDDLIPFYPTERLTLETSENDVSMRLVDLFSPIGKGQRGLIVAPPKTGKTTLLKKIAQSIEANNPEVTLIILLIDERPEEVTDIRRSVKGEVVYSTFDENAKHHIRAADLVINRAKRLVECGEDVVVLLDSITRLARAYNTVEPSSGKTLSGGLDPSALQLPKKFFGAARNIENGGSLTILSTALIDTESRMDDVIYEEFKGTGNMEIFLSNKLSEKRVFPAIDLFKSGTRKDELLLSKEELETARKLRGILAERQDATDVVINSIKKTSSNKDLIGKIDDWIKIYRASK